MVLVNSPFPGVSWRYRDELPPSYHLVGGGQQSFRDREAECLGGLEVDHELELAGLHDQEVGGLFALKNAGGIIADSADQVVL